MRQKRKQQRPKQTQAAPDFSNRPFRGLNAKAKVAAAPAPPPKPAAPLPPAPPDDATLFQQAMGGIRRLDEQQRQRIAAPPPALPAREMTDPDAEVLVELSDLVSGAAELDVTQSEEHVEGFVVGLDRQVIGRLRRGEFALQGHIDLHRLTTEQAAVELKAFLDRSFRDGKRCILVVHGRGMNSKDGIPVLRNWAIGWLARGERAKMVLAFATARPHDGGPGALYVLLRRRRDTRLPIQVTRGTAW